MNKVSFPKFFFSSLLIISISLFTIGGCDVDFSTPDDNSSGGGSNGGSGTGSENVEGTIVDVIPTRENDLENITAQVSDEDTLSTFSSTTSNTGFFSVQGDFAGNPELEFLDQDNSDSTLGLIILNVFPDAEVDIGDIRLENGNVVFEDETEITFEGDVIENNCTNNNGTIIVEAKNDQDEVDVIVQITNSTSIDRDGDDIDCNELLIGQEVEVRGELLIGNSVDANSIEVL